MYALSKCDEIQLFDVFDNEIVISVPLKEVTFLKILQDGQNRYILAETSSGINLASISSMKFKEVF